MVSVTVPPADNVNSATKRKLARYLAQAVERRFDVRVPIPDVQYVVAHITGIDPVRPLKLLERSPADREAIERFALRNIQVAQHHPGMNDPVPVTSGFAVLLMSLVGMSREKLEHGLAMPDDEFAEMTRRCYVAGMHDAQEYQDLKGDQR